MATQNVFVYGSLMSRDVLTILLRRVPKMEDAKLRGYHRFRVRDRVYPAIYKHDDAFVQGKVLLEITDEERRILDEFEDSEYESHPITATVDSTGQEVPASVYVFKNRDPLHGEWDYSEFERDHLPKFMTMCQVFADGQSRRVPF
eukprot:TRINITY_DN21695_c0_g1_i1.p1 TRINITY_DN21695_c0_g1~~TRINITY_DN21695_c0_g1_i1.p1  ORF type:complete len:145 (+),score=30.98 TRINITY_DN21695_c0_g1_i1:109-543(+)